MGPSEMSELYNDLYVHLLDQMHVALTALTDSTPKPRPAAAPDASSLAALKALADEVEVSGQAAARAEAVHQRRVLDDRNPAAWYDYGSFCLRAGKRGRGEECLREALAVDPRHRPSLLGLCCLCLAQGQLSDAMFYESAEVLAHELKEAEPTSPLAWGLLSLIYRGMGGAKAAEAEAAHRGVMKFCKERRAADKAAAAADVNGYYMAAEALASLCLPEATIKACALVDTLKLTKGQLAGEVALLQGEALRQMGNVQKALAAADAAARSLPVGDFRPRLLSASIHYSAKAWSDAGFGYQTVLTEAPAACSLEVYLRLGQCYLQLGRYIDAEHVFTAACAACGCASTWLGAGVAALRRGDLAAADLALTEANVLDPDHPAAWGHLALLSLKAGRVAEAESALKYAQKAGLSDSALELELGEELLALGQHLAAQTVAARVSAREPSFRSRLLQGKALIARKEAAAAKAELDEAAALAKTADEQSALSAAMDDLNTLPPSL